MRHVPQPSHGKKICTGRPTRGSMRPLLASATVRGPPARSEGSSSSSPLVNTMRSSQSPPVNQSRADHRREPHALLPWAHWRGRQLAALWTVLWFCGLIAASGPHLVHHLTALPRPADHHAPADEPRPLDCGVFSLMQHTPVAEGILNPLPTPLPGGEPSIVEPSLTGHTALWSRVLARAPPV
jgi:hypothetical protein